MVEVAIVEAQQHLVHMLIIRDKAGRSIDSHLIAKTLDSQPKYLQEALITFQFLGHILEGIEVVEYLG